MLKSIKVSEEAYRAIRKLGKELEKEKMIEGVYSVSLTTAIRFAVDRALKEVERERRFSAAAGAWKNADTDKMIKSIYGRRRFRTRWDVSMD